MPSPLPHITVSDAFGNQREIEISRAPFTLGRQGDNDLVLLDTRISRHHARILKDDESYLLEDAGSRHGTFEMAYRSRVAQAASRATRLALGCPMPTA